MSREILVMEGSYDPKTHTSTMTSKGVCPSGKPYDMKMTTKHEGEDSMLFTMEMKMEETGGEFVKMIEIAYKRRPK